MPTAPPKAFYRASRSDTTVKTGRQTQRQILQAAGKSAHRFWLQRFGSVILLGAALISAINILTLSDSAIIQPLAPSRQAALLRPMHDYQAAANRLLKDSIWNRNKLTVNTGNISRHMLQQFPELSSVSVAMPLLAHRPVVYLQPADPALILTTGQGAFLVDTSGKALLKAPTIAELNRPMLPVVTDRSGLLLELGKQALPEAHVTFIKEVLAQLATKKVDVATLALPPAASELDLQLAGQTYQVKFNLQNDTARQQVGTLLATLGQLEKQHITPSKYIDVRVDGRAYYQ